MIWSDRLTLRYGGEGVVVHLVVSRSQAHPDAILGALDNVIVDEGVHGLEHGDTSILHVGDHVVWRTNERASTCGVWGGRDSHIVVRMGTAAELLYNRF